jgi:hypothetical protein
VRRLRPELWRQNNWLLHHDITPPYISIFAMEFFTKSNMAVVPNPQPFSVFPIEDKTEHPPF